MLVKIEVELLSYGMVLFHNFHSQATDFSFSAIVEPAIIKDELHVVHEVLDARIFVLLQLCLDCREIHWVLYNVRIVFDFELLVINGVSEDVSFLVPLERRQQSLSSLLPLVENGSTFRNLGNT